VRLLRAPAVDDSAAAIGGVGRSKNDPGSSLVVAHPSNVPVHVKQCISAVGKHGSQPRMRFRVIHGRWELYILATARRFLAGNIGASGRVHALGVDRQNVHRVDRHNGRIRWTWSDDNYPPKQRMPLVDKRKCRPWRRDVPVSLSPVHERIYLAKEKILVYRSSHSSIIMMMPSCAHALSSMYPHMANLKP
jgi:hypothetical protein